MDAKELGARLRSARELRALSQQAAALAMDLPRTAITQLEAGRRSVSTLELTRFAELYRLSVSDLLRGKVGDEDKDVLVTLYRAAPGLEDDPLVREEVTRNLRLCREGVVLERLLGANSRSGPPSYEMRRPRSPGEAVAQGEEVAEQERRRLGLGSAPIADISELIVSQGVWASSVSFPDGMSGLFLRHPDVGLAILVNARHVKGRKRFSFAHEYAHALVDRNGVVAISSVDNSSDLVETRANAFAAAFLMPEDGIRAFLRTHDKDLPARRKHAVFEVAGGGRIEAELRPSARAQRIACKDSALLAHRFGVSYRAAVYRLKSLRYISDRESKDLLGQERFGRRYLKELGMFADVGEQEEQHYRDRELRSEVAHLAIEAYRREEISRGRLLELSAILGVTGDTLLSLGEAARGE